MSAATIHRTQHPLEKARDWVRLAGIGALPASLRVTMIVRAWRSDRPQRCGCRGCTYTIKAGEWHTYGNQHDDRGRYPRCFACMPFESAKEQSR